MGVADYLHTNANKHLLRTRIMPPKKKAKRLSLVMCKNSAKT